MAAPEEELEELLEEELELDLPLELLDEELELGLPLELLLDEELELLVPPLGGSPLQATRLPTINRSARNC